MAVSKSSNFITQAGFWDERKPGTCKIAIRSNKEGTSSTVA
jgi:hypothetical protein